MKYELFGKRVIKVTLIILIVEILLRITALIPKLYTIYSDFFAGIMGDFNILILYFVPFLNMLLLIVYLIGTYISKKNKNLNFQIIMYIMFYILFLVSSYIFVVIKA
jgi:hypothetical protein